MKMLVVGRDGQLARSLAERAAARPGLELVALGRPDLDLEQPGSAEKAVGRVAPDLVVNTAAYTAVDKAEDEPERAHRINGEAPGELALAAAAAGARMIQVSTDYVFDGHTDRPYREEDPTAPLGVYGATKLAGEQAVRAAAPDAAIVRTAWVYSPFGANFVKTMIGLAERSDEIKVVADQRGNPTSALDLADGLLAIVDAWAAGAPAAGVYHLAGSGEASRVEFVEAIFAECAAVGLRHARVTKIRTEDWPTRATRPADSRLDCGRFLHDFGFVMPDWRESTAAVVRRIAAERGVALPT